MRILNLLWGFSAGGIGRCFLSYNRLGDVATNVFVRSVCIDIESRSYDRSLLKQNGIGVIGIKNLRDVSWLRKVRDAIVDFEPDIIFCHGFNGPVVVWTVKKMYKIRTPMVCTYHGAYHPPKAIKKLYAPVYNAAQMRLYRKSAHRIITVENRSRELLIARGVAPEKVVTVPNGISDNAFGPVSGIDENFIRFCTISRLDRIKGLSYLIEALSLLEPDARRKIRLSIIGEGPEYNRLRSLAEVKKVHEIIRFEGYQSKVEEWLGRSDVFLLPSLSECHSISLLEAMRAGKAIIASGVGGTPDAIRDGVDGIIIPPANVRAIANAMMRLILNPELIGRYGQNARDRFLKRFTEAAMLRNLVNVITAEA